MGCDPLPLRLMGSMTHLRGGGSHPKMKLQGEERLLWPAIWISHYDFGIGCDPPPSPLNGINEPFKRGGSHPKMKLHGEQRLLQPAIWISHYDFGMRSWWGPSQPFLYAAASLSMPPPQERTWLSWGTPWTHRCQRWTWSASRGCSDHDEPFLLVVLLQGLEGGPCCLLPNGSAITSPYLVAITSVTVTLTDKRGRSGVEMSETVYYLRWS